MTRPLLTRYHIGDRVLVTAAAADLAEMGVSPGGTGVIRRISVCDPNDGDKTALYFDVALDDGGDVSAMDDEMAPFQAVEAWLGRQMARQALRQGQARHAR